MSAAALKVQGSITGANPATPTGKTPEHPPAVLHLTGRAVHNHWPKPDDRENQIKKHLRQEQTLPHLIFVGLMHFN
jgi:hypothetical protein